MSSCSRKPVVIPILKNRGFTPDEFYKLPKKHFDKSSPPESVKLRPCNVKVYIEFRKICPPCNKLFSSSHSYKRHRQKFHV